MRAAPYLRRALEALRDNRLNHNCKNFSGQTHKPIGRNSVSDSQMPKLCSSRTLLDAATRGGKAIAALNFYNAETLLAHMRAARVSRESIILQTTESTIDYLGLRMILGMAAAAANQLEEPVALHLDHGSSYELAARCIDAGYTSVMIDGSKLPFAENCALTRRVVNLAHAAGVSVEGELGHVGQNSDSEDPSETFTRPEDAARFMEETG